MILFFVAAVFALYFITVAIYTGMESKFHLVWLFLAVMTALFGLIAELSTKGLVRIPDMLKLLFTAIWLVLLLLIIGIVMRIVSVGKTVPEPGAACIIVLGVHVNGTHISRALQNRLDTAFDYIKNSPDTLCFLSGARGPGEDITEAKAMQSYLVQRGISPEKLILEEGSFNTEENIVNCRAMAELDDQPVIVVTNRFHLFRAISICKKQGMKQVQGLAAKDHPIMIPTYYLREVMAILDYKRKNKI